ncbi:MAG: metallophosphoesterase [Victivallaceae bacterium]
MMKKSLLSLLLLFTLFVAAEEITVLAVSDTHAKVENLRRLLPLYRAELAAADGKVITVDAGDTLQGSFEAIWGGGVIPREFQKLYHFDIWVPGNHDFEIQPWRFRDYPGTILGADWTARDFSPLKYQIREVGKYRIALIGLGESNLKYRVLPSLGLVSTPHAEALAAAMAEVRRAKPDGIILVRHDGEFSGTPKLAELIALFPEIDLVIGGHSHQEVPGGRVARTHFVQTGKHAEALGVIKFDFDPVTGKLNKLTSELKKPAETSRVELPAELETLLAEAARDKAEIAFTAAEPLANPTTPVFDNALGRLIGRAMRRAADARVALLVMYTGERTWPREISFGTLYDMFPYENRICRIELTPGQFETMMQASAEILQKGKRSFLFDGVSVTTDKRGRLTGWTIPDPGPDGKIAVAVCDYDLAGGGAPTVLRQLLERGVPFRETPIPLRDAVLRQQTNPSNP